MANLFDGITTALGKGVNFIKDAFDFIRKPMITKVSEGLINAKNEEIKEQNELEEAERIAEENNITQKEIWEREDAIRKELQEREDTAYQRTVADMQKAGINIGLLDNINPVNSNSGNVNVSSNITQTQMQNDLEEILNEINNNKDIKENSKDRLNNLINNLVDGISRVIGMKALKK